LLNLLDNINHLNYDDNFKNKIDLNTFSPTREYDQTATFEKVKEVTERLKDKKPRTMRTKSAEFTVRNNPLFTEVNNYFKNDLRNVDKRSYF